MKAIRSIVDAFLKGRFSLLLTSFFLLFLIGPLMPGSQVVNDRIIGVLLLVVLASCIRAISVSRHFFIFMIIFTLVNLGLGAIEMVGGVRSFGYQTVEIVLRLIYFFIIFFSIMHYVLDRTPVTADKLCGALSAYLIMGIAWTFVYALFYHLDPGCFEVPEKWMTPGINSAWTYYFSFTTLTTLGYGDLVPLTSAVQSYAIMEAVSGQLFLAVIVARLIALHIIYAKAER